MIEKEFKKELRAIESKAENQLGCHLPEGFRRIVASHIETDGHIRYYNDPEEDEHNIRWYSELMENYVEAIQSLPNYSKAKVSTSNGKEKQATLKKIYRKPFEHRLHLLDFVLKRKGFTARANWKQLTAEWNAEYPYDQYSLRIFKLKYYQARKDNDLMNSYVVTKLAPLIKQGMRKTINFWKQHPEAKTLNELIEIEEAQNER